MPDGRGPDGTAHETSGLPQFSWSGSVPSFRTGNGCEQCKEEATKACCFFAEEREGQGIGEMSLAEPRLCGKRNSSSARRSLLLLTPTCVAELDRLLEFLVAQALLHFSPDLLALAYHHFAFSGSRHRHARLLVFLANHDGGSENRFGTNVGVGQGQSLRGP